MSCERGNSINSSRKRLPFSTARQTQLSSVTPSMLRSIPLLFRRAWRRSRLYFPGHIRTLTAATVCLLFRRVSLIASRYSESRLGVVRGFYVARMHPFDSLDDVNVDDQSAFWPAVPDRSCPALASYLFDSFDRTSIQYRQPLRGRTKQDRRKSVSWS
jgi:hypothetical protein